MMFYCGLMVHITDTRTQKVVSYTSAHITETVLAHDRYWEEHSSLSSPQLYRHSQKHRKWSDAVVTWLESTFWAILNSLFNEGYMQ